MFTRIAQYLRLSRQRRDLRDLDDHLLADIGLTRAEALEEAARPIWDAPHHWVAPVRPRRAVPAHQCA